MKHLSILTLAVLLPALIAAPEAVEFTQITTGEIVHDGGWNYGCAWGDYDNDGYPDLFVVNNDTAKDNFLYHNEGDGTFTKITSGPVVTDGGSSYGCTWGDYDNDGYLDLFVANYNEDNFLYRNRQDGTFQAVLSGPVVTGGGSSAGCSWADYDTDGWLDLYVCNRTSANFLYRNNRDGTFTRVLTGAIVTDNDNSGACSWGDYDGDGDPDLIVANAGPDYNCLYRNLGDGTFEKVTGDPVVTTLSHSDGAAWGDYDNDGDLDLFVVSGVVGYGYDYLYQNNGDATFTQVLSGPPVENNHWAEGSSWGDYDNDGDLDLFVGIYDGPGGQNRLYENRGGGLFMSIDSGPHIEAGNYSKGTTWADYDQDGDLDIFIAKNNYFGGDNVLFRNEGTLNQWLKVRAVGTVSNRCGMGAAITVHAAIGGAPVRQLRQISGQSGGGTSAQDGLIARFGLGDAAFADSILVRWPSGIVDRLLHVAAGQEVVVTEGSMQHIAASAMPVLIGGDRNPFRGETTICFHLVEPAHVRLEVFDAQGRLEETLLSAPRGAGDHAVRWDAAGRSGGLYFARISTDRGAGCRRLVLLGP